MTDFEISHHRVFTVPRAGRFDLIALAAAFLGTAGWLASHVL